MLVLVLIFVSLLFFLFCPIRFHIFLRGNKLKANCKVLCFSFNFIGEKNVFEGSIKKDSEGECPNKYCKKQKKIVMDNRKVIIVLLNGLKDFIRSLKCFQLFLEVGAIDSATVALRYGYLCAIMAMLEKYVFGNTRGNRIEVAPNFSCECNFVSFFSCKFRLNLFIILKNVVSTISKIMKAGVFCGRKAT